jgi:REP element-mobilizing transposase RayT
MPRTKRKWISGQLGSMHIISRTARNDIMFSDEEKEYFMEQIQRFASGFYVDIHAFCVMGTHFHILASSREWEAKNAEDEELYRRYRLIYGEDAAPPAGSYDTDGSIIPDEDGGIERLRLRLGSISRFVQELKQSFSRWYNKKHNRKGYLWNDRFKGVIVDKGEAQLVCSAYIDLNPVRANMVTRPEDYRWSSLGLRVRSPGGSQKLLGQFLESLLENNEKVENGEINPLSWYREFVYLSGGIEKEGKGTISQELVNDVKSYHGKLGIGDSFRYRVKNISEGIAIGTFSFISVMQERYKRKFIRPRSFLPGNRLFATRVLRL